jgi:hypothetical protein
MFLSQRLWLGLPPALLCLADVTLTLYGQPQEYWQGEYAAAQADNSLVCEALRQGPGMFLLTAALWVLTFLGLLLFWRDPLIVVLALALTVTHTMGVATNLLGKQGGALVTLFCLCLSTNHFVRLVLQEIRSSNL